MKPKAEIEQTLLSELGNRDEIVFAYCFGSFVEADRFADVDLAIYISPKSFPVSPSIDFELSAKLEKAIGIPVDVIILNRAPDHLIHQISKGKLLLDRDIDLRADFITAAWKRYFDIQPKRREYLKERTVVA